MVEFPNYNLKKNIMYLVLIIAIIFLFAHTFNWTDFTIDTTSIILLLLILLTPFIGYIRKIKYGDIEAEITPEEVEKTLQKADVEDLPIPEVVDEIREEIFNLVQSDPQLGLTKLRIEIEKTLKSLLGQKKPNARFFTIPKLIDELLRSEVIPRELASALKDILPLVNRAAHGEYIKQDDANKITETGVSILNNLKEIYKERTFQPIEKTNITLDDIEMYEQSKYRVTTVIPLVETPEKNVYIWDRETLMDFLFDSAQYAEFPISIERIDE